MIRFRRRLSGAVLYVLPTIPDDASSTLKDALGVRNAATVSRRCACDATGTISGPDSHGIYHLVFEHELDCPATNDNVRRLVAREDPPPRGAA